MLGDVLRPANLGEGKKAVEFWCPGCDRPHFFIYESSVGGPVWNWDGNTKVPLVTPSIKNQWTDEDGKDQVCHLFIRGGYLDYLADCTHEMAGRMVSMVQWSSFEGFQMKRRKKRA